MTGEIQLHSHISPSMAEPLDDSILPIQSNRDKQHGDKSKLVVLPLVFLTYFEVSGGPYGSEQIVQSGGPLLAILGFLLLPFMWSIPEALISAELSTALPGNGVFVLWTYRAFGPFTGSLIGTWKFLSGAINSGAYPALCVDYVTRNIPSISSGVNPNLCSGGGGGGGGHRVA